jgi:ADP-ribosyl-[dinitrogen reductase] hydrolase
MSIIEHLLRQFFYVCVSNNRYISYSQYMDNSLKLRIIGVFFGQLIGDSLGTRYEFKKKEKSTSLLLSDTIDKKLPMLGGGPFNVKAGQYTDDSELSLGIWYSILENDGYDIKDISKQFYNWFYSGPFDIGNATRTAFEHGKTYDEMLECAKSNSYSLSNGCLMKISAIGVVNFISGNQMNSNRMAREVCELTNPHPICIDICTCYVRAIEMAIKTGNPQKSYDIALSVALYDITKLILKDAILKSNPTKLMNESRKITEVVPDQAYQGYIGIAFQNAFYHLLNTKTFNEVMVQTICLGGDVDTNACIAGALYGACFGADKLNKEWVGTVMNFTSSEERIDYYPPLNHQHVYSILRKKLHKL